jgi:hypothetical protein
MRFERGSNSANRILTKERNRIDVCSSGDIPIIFSNIM